MLGEAEVADLQQRPDAGVALAVQQQVLQLQVPICNSLQCRRRRQSVQLSILLVWYRLICRTAPEALLTVPRLLSVTTKEVTAACDAAQKMQCVALVRQYTSGQSARRHATWTAREVCADPPVAVVQANDELLEDPLGFGL